MKNILYFNGDSWTHSVFFMRACAERFSKSHQIINTAIGGNWNKLIVESTINDLKYLSVLAQTQNITIHAFVFLSEWLRGGDEIDILKMITKKHGIADGINGNIEKIINYYVQRLTTNVGKLSNVQLTVSTAFTDHIPNGFLPMYMILVNKLNLVAPISCCYNISYLNKHGDKQLLEMGFNKAQVEEFLDCNLDRCKLLESFPKIKTNIMLKNVQP